MDIEAILEKHRKDLLNKYKHQQQDHVDVEQIIRFARDQYNLELAEEEQEYNTIIEHLTHCKACKEEIKTVREMIKQESELFEVLPEIAGSQEVDKTWETFVGQLAGKKKREKAKIFSIGFLKKLYPQMVERFLTTWEILKELPVGTDLVLFQEQSPVFALTDPQLKKEQILLVQVAFAAMATFDRSGKKANLQEQKEILLQFARENKLPRKLRTQLEEYLDSL